MGFLYLRGICGFESIGQHIDNLQGGVTILDIYEP